MIRVQYFKDQPIPDLYPYHSDRRFDDEKWHTVFTNQIDPAVNERGIDQVIGATYINPLQLPVGTEEEARARTGSKETAETALFFEEMGKIALERDDVEVVHILSRRDPATGDPRVVFGVVTPDTKEAAQEQTTAARLSRMPSGWGDSLDLGR